MHNKYDKWEQDAPRWRAELEKSLMEHGGNDLVTHYRNVALAFPSRSPHISTFDYPRIDEPALEAWANEHAWRVRTAPEMEPGRDQASPPIRFTRH